MKSISVTEFKAHCLELVNRVAASREPLILTKRGKPTAMVSPPPAVEGKKWIPGQFRDKGKIVGDVIAPFDEPWEAPGPKFRVRKIRCRQLAAPCRNLVQ